MAADKTRWRPWGEGLGGVGPGEVRGHCRGQSGDEAVGKVAQGLTFSTGVQVGLIFNPVLHDLTLKSTIPCPKYHSSSYGFVQFPGGL